MSTFDDDLERAEDELPPDAEIPVDTDEFDTVAADEHVTPLGAELEADIATEIEAYESE